MPFAVNETSDGLMIDLSGDVTVRHSRELAEVLAASLKSGMPAAVDASRVEDIDTNILQLLVALRRSAAEFRVERASETFLKAVDRCALRRELDINTREDCL
jgi:anti-anti-sigma regulatory factor